MWHLEEMTPKEAHNRLRILRFWDTHGLLATLDAFEVSRRTLTRWKAELRAQDGNTAALAAKNSAPRRRPRTDPRLGTEIRRLRTLHPNLGKEKLHVLRGPWCEEHGLPRPSVSTIGRIIARAPDKMRFAPPVWILGAVPGPSDGARSPGNPPEPTPRPSNAGRWIPSSVFVTVFDAPS